MTQVTILQGEGAEEAASDVQSGNSDRDLAAESVFYALFRIVELAEYAGPDKAIGWAQSALSDRSLLHGFVERVWERSHQGHPVRPSDSSPQS